MSLTKIKLTKENISDYMVLCDTPYINLRFIMYRFNPKTITTTESGFKVIVPANDAYHTTSVFATSYELLINHPCFYSDRMYDSFEDDLALYGVLKHDGIVYVYEMYDSGNMVIFDKKLKELLRNGLSIYDAMEFLCI